MGLMNRARYRIFGVSLIAIVGVLTVGWVKSTASYFMVDIDSVGYETVAKIKQQQHVRWWVEAGDQLFVLAGEGFEASINRPVTKLDIKPHLGRLYTVQRGHSRHLQGIGADVLVSGGRKWLIQAHSDAVPELKELHKHDGRDEMAGLAHARLTVFEPNQIFARQEANDLRQKRKIPWRNDIAEMVEQVDGARWFADIEYLASLNRNSYQQGVEVARDWLVSQFESIGLSATLQPFKMGSHTVHNVIAKIEGTERPDEWFIVGGHYDSTSERPSVAAPGAEDNATGAAGVLEMARIFAAHPPAATVYFIAFGGEEQGLNGSRAHIDSVVADNNHTKIKGVINMDMIGFSKTPKGRLKVLLETEPVATDLMNTLRAAANTYTELEVLTTFEAWGSDHVPYLRRKVPAVLTIDNDYGSYPAYHRTTDTPEKVVIPMGVGILRMNVATLAQLAL